MKKLIVITTILFAGAFAQAQSMGVLLGVRSDSADGKGGLTVDSKTNFQVGGVGFFDFTSVLRMRTGFIYAMKNYGLKDSTGTSGEAKLAQFEVPLGVLFKFSDFGGAFIGPAISMNVSKSCTLSSGSCTIEEVPSVSVPIQLGASLKFAPELGVEFYFETVPGKLFTIGSATGENSKAVVVNLLYTFD